MSLLIGISIAILILFIIGLIVFFSVIYTAHKEYMDRLTLPGHQVKATRRGVDVSGNGLMNRPLANQHAQDNIFLSLVFPAYNEEKRISPVIKETIEYFDNKKISYEIIITNDGSKDGTLKLLYEEE